MALPFHNGSRIFISGCSGSGKSFLVAEMIKRKNEVFLKPPEQIFYFSKHKSSIPEKIWHDVSFRCGLPSTEDFENSAKATRLIVIDDMQNELFHSPDVIRAFQTCRHFNCSIIILCQNLFPRAPRARDVTLNCTHIIIFFNPRDSSCVLPLSRQLNPLKPNLMANIFFTFINEAYKYLLINLTPTSDAALRYSSSIFSPAVEIYLSDEQLNTLKNGSSQKESAFDFQLSEAE